MWRRGAAAWLAGATEARCGGVRWRGARRRAVARAAACGDDAEAARARCGGAACGGRRRAVRAAAGVQVRWRRGAVATRNSGSTSPLLCLSARDVEGKGRGPKLIGWSVIGPGPWERPGPLTHRSRAASWPGTCVLP